MSDFLSEDELLAAIDLGSNSFHLAIARLDHGEVRKVASMSEKVQLAAGLDADGHLNKAAQQRGIDCLSRFVGRLDAVAPGRTRIVATNALRQAVNAQEFIQSANSILPKPIEVIAGREEARLIYLGVSHTNASTHKRLVIDIGGGSTELIIGEGFEPIHTESMQMGCVAFSKAYFKKGKITPENFDHAVAAAQQELLGIVNTYKDTGWDSVVGSSGTIKAAKQILVNMGLSNEQEEITRASLKQLKKAILNFKHVDDIDFVGIKDNRKAVLPAGVAILHAVFKSLDIDTLSYSDGALREGVLYDMLGRFKKEDVRDRSVQAMMQRYHVDSKQALRVANTALQLFNSVADTLKLTPDDADILRWAAYQHEIGLSISHSGFHRHSAYLLEHSDVPGFSQIDQTRMAQLVFNHRRKLKSDHVSAVLEIGGQRLIYMCLILRLAVLIHHSRSDDAYPELALYISDGKPQQWRLCIDAAASDWLMLVADLVDEMGQFKNWGYTLQYDTLTPITTVNEVSA